MRTGVRTTQSGNRDPITSGGRQGAPLPQAAAHDIKNLLFLIRARSERLRRGLAPDHPNRAELEAILDAARHGVALTLELLAARTGSEPAPAPLDVNSVVHSLRALLSARADQQVRVVTSLDPALAPVRARFSQLEQVLTNLVINACDAMPNGGTLTIATANGTSAEAEGRETVVVTVTDTGTGIGPEVLGRIFDPFFTTKHSSGGTGLGLAIVRGLVAQMDGFIEVDTAPAEGTSVRVILPSAGIASPAGAAAAREAIAEGALLAPARILIAEDDPEVLDVLHQGLRDIGEQLLIAASGREALERNAGRCADLLVTDVNLGDVSGIELAATIRERNPWLRVVFITGEQIRELPLSVADAHVLEKPFSLWQLRRAVRSALHPGACQTY